MTVIGPLTMAARAVRIPKETVGISASSRWPYRLRKGRRTALTPRDRLTASGGASWRSAALPWNQARLAPVAFDLLGLLILLILIGAYLVAG